MMWGRVRTATLVMILGLAANGLSNSVALADRIRDYNPAEFRALLRGLGYGVDFGNTLNDQAAKRAITQFQQDYRLPVDGTPNAATQNLAADLMTNLQGSLNVVVKPETPLPHNQFYGPQTEAAIRQFQKSFIMPETEIASLPVRQRLDQEAKKILLPPPPQVQPSTQPTDEETETEPKYRPTRGK